MPSAFSRWAVLSWLIDHRESLAEIIEAAQEFVAVEGGCVAHSEAACTLIRLCAPMADEILGIGAEAAGPFGETDEKSLCGAAGIDWTRIAKFLPIILKVLAVLVAKDE